MSKITSRSTKASKILLICELGPTMNELFFNFFLMRKFISYFQLEFLRWTKLKTDVNV
jgi:hypothetical protein